MRERGYAAMTMRDLAGAVGIRAPSLYKHFDSKQALLTSILLEMCHAMGEGLDLALSGVDPDPLARLDAFVQFHVAFHIEHRDKTFVCFNEYRSLEHANQRAFVKLRDAYQARVEAIVAAGRHAGVFHTPDIKVTTYSLLAMLTDIHRWYRESGPKARDVLIGHYVLLARSLLGAPD
ncbi:TetR/AcrR family transcriptional regulator [Aquabacterium sp. A7-Y]|uniref:TetR/AcrR family transcriptional regulator n=1 Tax=Aquabacterium sp. A7-Y TaxID=1349605 RepID=UPI00223C944A|nr:TetR/AcrR family transcriptional regulator [Aquabacterium sp. A7-Y]MCW7538207.1 TetR/AcrR family transcriptional regulator [Aquabacterium sp. A7-Y]